MTNATNVRKPDGIQYRVEELPGDRGQLVAGEVAGGRRAERYGFGSRAPGRRAEGGRAVQPLPDTQPRGGGHPITTDNGRSLTPPRPSRDDDGTHVVVYGPRR